MMTMLEQTDLWLHAAGVLAGGSTLFVLAAWFVSRQARSGSEKRMAWQTAVAGILLLASLEFTGTGHVLSRLTQCFRIDGTPRPELPDAAAPPLAVSAVATVPRGAQIPELAADKLVIESTNKSELWVKFNDVPAVAVRPFEAVPRVATPSTPSPVSDKSSERQNHLGSLTSLAAERETWERDSGWSWAQLAEPVLGFLWLSVAVTLAVWYCISRIRVAQLQRRCWTIDDDQRLAKVARLARQLGIRRQVRLVESDRLSGPVTYGIVRPTIALPVDFTRRFANPQQETVLAHELSHIASWDAAWQLAADGAACLLWWQPLVWWLRRQFRSTCESAADEASLLLPNGPNLLAECLVALGRQRADSPSVAWLWVAGKKSNLTERVESLLRLTQHAGGSRPIVRGRLLRVFVLMVMMVVAVTGATWLHPSEAFAEKDLTMRSMLKQSLAGVTLMAVLGTTAETLSAQDEDLDVESAVSIDIEHEIEPGLHDDEDSDCKVEWEGDWYDAKVLKKKPGSWYIHYVGDDDSWDEWVGNDRIRWAADAVEGQEPHEAHGHKLQKKAEQLKRMLKELKGLEGHELLELRIDDLGDVVGDLHIDLKLDELKELKELEELGSSASGAAAIALKKAMRHVRDHMKPHIAEHVVELVVENRIEDHSDRKRIQHLEVAIANLRAGGFDEMAKELESRMNELIAEPPRVHDVLGIKAHEHEARVRRSTAHDHKDQDAGEAHEVHEVGQTDREMDDLRSQIDSLREELAEMRRVLEQKDSR